MKFRTLLALSVLFPALPFTARAQKSYYSSGSQSPVIEGVKAQITYRNKENVEMDIPEELSGFVAGLLLTNDVQLNKCQDAVEAWMGKYRFLESRIKAETNAGKKTAAMSALRKGDFQQVEQTLQLKNTGGELAALFPMPYAAGNPVHSSGNQSPIIIGDYATVNYVVERVVTYKLPESLTKNILLELRNKNTLLGSLESSVVEKDRVIAEWVKRYRDIEEKLKNSPGEVSREAHALFAKGDLDGALKKLQQLDGSKETIGRGCYLQGQIIGLNGDVAKFDSLTTLIGKYYAQAASLSDSFDIHRDYAYFLIERALRYQEGFNEIQVAKKLPHKPLDEVSLVLEEGLAAGFMQNIELSEKKAREGLKLLQQLPNQEDTLAFYYYSMAYTNLAQCTSIRANSLANVPIQQNNTHEQIVSKIDEVYQLRLATLQSDSLGSLYYQKMLQRSKQPRAWFYATEFLHLNNIASHSINVETTARTRARFETAIAYMEKNYRANPFALTAQFTTGLTNFGHFLFNIGDTEAANNCFQRARQLLDAAAGPEIQASYLAFRQTYSDLFGVAVVSCRAGEALEIIDDIIEKARLYGSKNENFGSGYVAEIMVPQSELLYKTGHYRQSAAICEQLAVEALNAPLPFATNLQGSAYNVIKLGWLGSAAYAAMGKSDSALVFVDRLIPVFEKFKGAFPYMATFCDASLYQLDCQKGVALYLCNKPAEAETIFRQVVQRSLQLFKYDPVNAMDPYVTANIYSAKILSDKQEHAKAWAGLETAYNKFQESIPVNMQPQFVRIMLPLLSEQMEHLAADKFESIALLKMQALEPTLAGMKGQQNDIQEYNQSGALSIDNKHRSIARYNLACCRVLEKSINRKTSKTELQNISRQICTLAEEGINLICPEWKDAKAVEHRAALEAFRVKYCGAGN